MESQSQPHLIVDAWNIGHAWVDVRSHWTRGPAAVAAVLETKLRILHDLGGWEVTLVFDGRSLSGEKPAPDGAGTLALVYTEAGLSADAYIERLVASSAAPARIRVATGDRALAQAVFALGADILSPRTLLEEVERLTRQPPRSLGPGKAVTENPFASLDGLFPALESKGKRPKRRRR